MKWIFLSIILSACSSFYYYPDNLEHYPPGNYGYSFEPINLQSEDGTRLKAMFFKARSKSNKGTVLYFHGNAENMTSHYLQLIWLIDYGYNLFIFDYRGYGQSEGSPNPKGIKKDALAALNYTYEKFFPKTHDKKLFVAYGQSLGGAVLMDALSEFNYYEQLDLVVMDSTFTNYKALAIDKLKGHWSLYPLIPIAFLFLDNSGESTDFIDEIAPTPILVIHGTDDPVVPFKFGQNTFDNAKKPKDFWVVSGGMHTDAFFRKHYDYKKKFVAYLDKLYQKKNKLDLIPKEEDPDKENLDKINLLPDLSQRKESPATP